MSTPRDLSKPFAQIIAKAWADPVFKEEFMKMPVHVFKQYGILVDAGTEIRVHENTASVLHLVIPPRPRLVAETDEDPPTGIWCWCDIDAYEMARDQAGRARPADDERRRDA